MKNINLKKIKFPGDRFVPKPRGKKSLPMTELTLTYIH